MKENDDRDKIVEILQGYTWTYADKDPVALSIIRDRIESAARIRKMHFYSELVTGVVFHLPNVHEGRDYEIQTDEWQGLDRRIIGDFLGKLSGQSFIDHGFMLSAIVIGKYENQPSDFFFDWMKEINILTDLNEPTILKFWAEQVKKIFSHYASGGG
ncbi:MAG: hypothetical protein IIA59_11915 [Candidatus Marinimicrobia bacterium]|nr:hypothetical protein [Candidatus Neomarinimicrobiota bacterium]